ncbi:hypothetical protein ACROYT_G022659 [Oculina patagonica]
MSDWKGKKRPWSDERDRGNWKRPRSDEHERRHEGGKAFDLMPSKEKCDTFKVSFDYYTPRAHFIILPRDRSGTDFNSLDKGDRLKVVKAAMAMVSRYDLQNSAILSLHFGSWITTKNMFHAHVCVDVKEYLGVFEKKKNEIPNWPSQQYVTKQWKASKDPRNYAINVREYPVRTYFKDEVKSVKEYRRTKPSTSADGPSVTPSPPFTAILHHPSEPRVGFAVEKSAKPKNAESLLEAQEAIVKFASQNKLTDMNAKGDDNGCHVCLVLDEKSHGFNLEDSQSLVGYIQLTGLKFYRDLCPHEKREDWFAQFSSMEDYKVYT